MPSMRVDKREPISGASVGVIFLPRKPDEHVGHRTQPVRAAPQTVMQLLGVEAVGQGLRALQVGEAQEGVVLGKKITPTLAPEIGSRLSTRIGGSQTRAP